MMKRIGELNKEVTNLKAEADRLKAEVERLNEALFKHATENHRLQVQRERLTKAGDAMASSIQFNEEMSQDYNGPTIVHQCVQRWREAKDGKQS